MSFNALLFVALALAQVAVPPLKARVTDLTGTLNAQQAAALEQTLAEFESRKGSQIAVLFVPTTKPDSAVEYGVRVFDAWKLGRKGVDDGVLLLVAKEDRRVQIITGRGVEGVLPDAIAKRIVDEDITPRFKQGDFYGGVRAGADRMMRLIEGERFPAPRAGAAPSQMPRWLDGQMLFIGVFIVFILGGIFRAIFGRAIAAGVIGGFVGMAAWFILSSLVVGVIAGVIAFIITVFNSGRSSGWSSGGGGWSSGGGFSGGGGGFSSGGGGFSGGGGGSAGGGAGGSW